MKREVLVFLLFCQIAYAADYYVSPSGTAPWTSCIDVSTPCALATANVNAKAGDTVHLRGGTYLLNSSGIDPKNTGTEANAITFTNYNEEQVIFNYIGSSISSHYAVNLNSDYTIERSYINIHGITFNNFNQHLWIIKGDHNEVSYCTFKGFNIDGGKLNWRGSTVYRNATYNHIHHCTFADYGGAGAVINQDGATFRDDNGVLFELGNENSADDDTSHNLIEDCHIYHGGHHVMGIDGNHNVVRNNYIHNDGWISLNGSYWANRVIMFTGFDPANSRNLFEGNRVAYGTKTTDADCAAGGGTLATKHNILRRNMFYRNSNHGNYLRGYYSVAADNHLYNNVYWHNGYDTSQTWKNCWSWEWTHAIVIDESDQGTYADIKDNVFKNNIFYDNRNYYGSQYPIIAFWPQRNLPDKQIIAGNWMEEGDPKFQDISATPNPMQSQFDFRLQQDSPCIDRGDFLTNITSPTGSGMQFQVVDAGYFVDGWGIIIGDIIQLQNQDQKVTINNVDYETNTIIVNATLTWTQGQGVSLAYEGLAPDIGAFEYPSGYVPVCGDGSCFMESCTSCPQDCGVCLCGNGICDDGETCSSCQADCVKAHDADDNPCDGCISQTELPAYLSLWKTTPSVTIGRLMDAIRIWKLGC